VAFDAYLFDLDGTLMDSTKLILESFHHTRRVHFGDRLPDDPEPVHRALEALNVAAGRAVVVGDSPHDVQAGKQAGVRTAAALWGPFPRSVLQQVEPTYWLEQPRDILTL
jgi:pyrophosphatase PpaX